MENERAVHCPASQMTLQKTGIGIVKPDAINDDALILLAHSISQKIEETLDYPGQIKVNVIRESRAVDYAK